MSLPLFSNYNDQLQYQENYNYLVTCITKGSSFNSMTSSQKENKKIKHTCFVIHGHLCYIQLISVCLQNKNDTKTLYRVHQELSGAPSGKGVPVKSKDGRLLTTAEEQDR